MANGIIYNWPASTPNGIFVYPTFSAFPTIALNGTVALAADTDVLYAYSTGSNSWVPIAGPSSVLSIGTLDGQTPSANGAVINVNSLYMQSASATIPGLVNTAIQSFAGKKTFIAGLDAGANQITNVQDPTTAQMAATKNYVDFVASGLQPIQACYAGSTANIVGTYSNGTAGVGATFTITATGAFTIDGTTPPVNSRILLKNQTSGFQNGAYNLTNAGSLGVSPILTRSLDYNTAADMNAGNLIPVINGTVNTTTTWLQTSTITTVGTDSLVFIEWAYNPADFLLKANNLSDVTSSSIAFNNISGMTTLGDTIYGGASGARSRLAANTTGTNKYLQSVSSGAPTWNQVAFSDLSGQASLTTQVSGILPIVNGGTNVSSVTTAPTATAFAGWDTNLNLSAINFIEGYTTTATAAGTTTLTVASTYLQFFTGSTTQTVTLPVTSTLVLGQQFTIVNNSSGAVTVQSSGSNTIQVMAANTQLITTCILTSGTGIASWSAAYSYSSGTLGTVTSVAMTVPAFLSISGSPITSSGTLAVSLSGTALPVANGGTGIVSGTSGGILGFTAAGTIASSGALTASQLIIGGGAGVTPSTLAAGSQYQVLTMGATNPGYGAVNLAQSAAITGALPIGNGGTGQITKAAAFDALSPMTTGGDLIYGGASGTGTRLANGTAGYLLQSNGTTLAPTWVAAPTTSPLTTKGDLYGYTSTNARVPIGTDGYVLTADAASTPGLKWAAPLGATATVDVFSGTGSQTAFTLSIAPVSVNNTEVYISGVYQQKATYSVSSTTLTFTTAPPSGTSNIEVNTGNNLSIGTPSNGSVTGASFATQTAGTFLAGPTSGSATTPTFRALQAPTLQKFTSGTGTYTLPAGVLYIKVRGVGAGGGGGGGGSAGSPGAGGTGGNSTFGSALLTANGGAGGGANAGRGGAGGSASLGSGPVGTALQGGAGGPGFGFTVGVTAAPGGGDGAASFFGGSGGGGEYTDPGFAAITNSGSGGGGGSVSAAGLNTGAGGGAGGFVDALISSPSATYSYAIGAAGTAGTAGTSGLAGGAGGSGYIEVTEYYQ